VTRRGAFSSGAHGAPGNAGLIEQVSRLLIGDLVGPYLEKPQGFRPERSADGDIGRIAASSDHQSSDPAGIVSRVERVPAAVQKNFQQPAKSIGASIAGTPISPRYPVA
jgi:hypothetical protein